VCSKLFSQAELADQRHELETQNRTSGEKCKIYTVRFFVNFLILIMLGGAGVAIYYAQDFSAEVRTGSTYIYYYNIYYNYLKKILSVKLLIYLEFSVKY